MAENEHKRPEARHRSLTTRRAFLRNTIVLLAGMAGAGGLAAGCASQPAPAPTAAAKAPAPTAAAPAPAATAAAPAPTKPPAGPAPTQAPAAAGGPVKRGGTLNILTQNDWVTMDPIFNTTGPYGLNMIYGEWIRWEKDEKSGQWGPKPEMIAEWDLKQDRIVFKLQKGIKFHDGTQWDAKAAKWNFDRMTFDPASNMKSYLGGIDDSRESKDELEKLKATAGENFQFSSKAVEVVDDYTVKLNLKAPIAPILMTLSNALQWNNPISPTSYMKQGKVAYQRNPVGAGPYRFVEWKSGTHVILERNPDYWRQGADGKPLPYIDKLAYRLAIDDSVRLLELKSGNGHFMELVQGKDIAGVKADSNLVFKMDEGQGNNYRMIFDSTNKDTPFRVKKLRQAMLYAIDRQAMVQTLGFGAGVALKYLLPKGMLAYDETLPFYGYDKAKAQQLLKEAVAENPAIAGPDGKVAVTLSLIERAVDKAQAEMIKQMADSIGFNVKIEGLERAAWVAKLVTVPGQPGGKFDFATMANPVIPSDPDDQWRTFYYSKGGFNAAHMNDPKWDKLIDDGMSTYDVAAREKLYRQAEQMAFDDPWYGYLWQLNWNWALSKKLKNFKDVVTNRWLFAESWLE